MVSTRRGTSSIAAADTASGDEGAVTSTRRSTRVSRAAAAKQKNLTPVAEADSEPVSSPAETTPASTPVKIAQKRTPAPKASAQATPSARRSRRAAAQTPPALSPVPATTTTAAAPADNESDSDSEAIAEAQPADAYADLMNAIMSGFGAPGGAADEDSASSSGDDGDGGMDTDDESAGPSGATASAGSADDEWRVASWQPDIAMPAAASASCGDAELVGKPEGLSKMAVAPIHDSRKAAKAAARARADTAGDSWFNMKAQTITDDVKRDWRLLRLRSAYDPRHFYKTFDSTKIPKYFQMGEVVEGAGEFYSGRLTKKQRKSTLTEELLADIKLKRERRKRYAKMQEEKQYWAKKRKRMQPKTVKRSSHRPKH